LKYEFTFSLSPQSAFLCVPLVYCILKLFFLRRIYVSLGFILSTPSFYAQQNFIINPSFESAVDPPSKRYSQYLPGEIIVNGWINPTGGTPDHFNSDKSKAGLGGIALAHSQQGRMGLVLSAGKNKPYSYKEYLETKLTAKLEANKKYCVSFYVAHDRTSKYIAPDLGVYFSPGPVAVEYQNELPVSPSWKFPSDTFLISQKEWTEICFPYYANGGEEFMVVGSFEKKKGIPLKSLGKKPEKKSLTGMRKNMAYYYFDDFMIYDPNGEQCQCERRAPLNENIIFLVDVSNSMSREHNLDSVKNVLTEFIPEISEKWKISLFSFTGNSKNLFSSRTKSEISDSLNFFISKLNASGLTNGGNAIEDVIRWIERNQLKNSQIVIYTDGSFTIDEEVREYIIEQSEKLNFRIHISDMGENVIDDLREIVGYTHGSHYVQGPFAYLINQLRKIQKDAMPAPVVYSK